MFQSFFDFYQIFLTPDTKPKTIVKARVHGYLVGLNPVGLIFFMTFKNAQLKNFTLDGYRTKLFHTYVFYLVVMQNKKSILRNIFNNQRND